MEKTLEKNAVRTQNPVRKLTVAGFFAALGCAATMVLQIPSPTGGYMNLGDTAVILGAYLLGPLWGAAAGGLGPALADLLSGYPVYVPATLVIKALMALTAAGLYRALGKRKGFFWLCAAAAEVPMVLGYWLFDALLASLASGSGFALCLMGSAAGIPSNLVQAGFGAAASTLLALALSRSPYVRRAFPHL